MGWIQKMASPKGSSFETLAVHAGQEPDPHTGAIITPIFQTSTFVQEKAGKDKGYDYSRAKNPTRSAYENCVAALEAGKENTAFGAAFASGCAATATLIHLLQPGDHVLCIDDLYGGTYRLFHDVLQKQGIEFSFVDLVDETQLEKEFRDNTKMVWIETPTNPLLKIVDIEKVARFAKSRNALLVVDNTFMSPYFQKPMDLGADIVFHSATKYLNGHSDIVGGVVVTPNAQLAEKIYYLQKCIGAVAGPFDAWLAMRGIKTLAIRMDRHESNANAIVKLLVGHKNVEKVYYPGLPDHPGHNIAKKQMTGFGGMISFTLKGGLEKARTVVESTQIFALAESLGGVESLIEHPGIMTHASVPQEIRAKLGIEDSLVRLSVGIEAEKDLLQDLERVLD